jgi:hypothetical protein
VRLSQSVAADRPAPTSRLPSAARARASSTASSARSIVSTGSTRARESTSRTCGTECNTYNEHKADGAPLWSDQRGAHPLGPYAQYLPYCVRSYLVLFGAALTRTLPADRIATVAS